MKSWTPSSYRRQPAQHENLYDEQGEVKALARRLRGEWRLLRENYIQPFTALDEKTSRTAFERGADEDDSIMTALLTY